MRTLRRVARRVQAFAFRNSKTLQRRRAAKYNARRRAVWMDALLNGTKGESNGE